MQYKFPQTVKWLCLFLLLIFTSQNVMAQRERNYIYLLDCTKSMSGYNGAPNIWVPTKNYLRSDIARQTPNTSIHVVPFQGNNLPTFSFMANKFAWKDMEKILDGYMNNITKQTFVMHGICHQNTLIATKTITYTYLQME